MEYFGEISTQQIEIEENKVTRNNAEYKGENRPSSGLHIDVEGITRVEYIGVVELIEGYSPPRSC